MRWKNLPRFLPTLSTSSTSTDGQNALLDMSSQRLATGDYYIDETESITACPLCPSPSSATRLLHEHQVAAAAHPAILALEPISPYMYGMGPFLPPGQTSTTGPDTSIRGGFEPHLLVSCVCCSSGWYGQVDTLCPYLGRPCVRIPPNDCWHRMPCDIRLFIHRQQ